MGQDTCRLFDPSYSRGGRITRTCANHEMEERVLGSEGWPGKSQDFSLGLQESVPLEFRTGWETRVLRAWKYGILVVVLIAFKISCHDLISVSNKISRFHGAMIFFTESSYVLDNERDRLKFHRSRENLAFWRDFPPHFIPLPLSILLNGPRKEGFRFQPRVKLPSTNVFVVLTVDKSVFEQAWGVSPPRYLSPAGVTSLRVN